MLLTGKEVSRSIVSSLKEVSNQLCDLNIKPTLALVRIGNKPDDIAYEKSIEKKCDLSGVNLKKIVFALDSNKKDILKEIKNLNKDFQIHGILVFRPLKDKVLEEEITNLINVNKDVDCMREDSAFLPCTPEAVMELIRYYNIDVKGKKVTVLGRSKVIGKPVAKLLEQSGGIVTVCHSQTTNTNECIKNADIIISATGIIGIVNKDNVSTGQVVIDVGINENTSGNIVGDVDFENVSTIVSAITPVPGGIGSITTALLCKHVIEVASKNII